MKSLRRWPHPKDLKPDEVLDFLTVYEPRIDQKANRELIRVLCWALPLYAGLPVNARAAHQSTKR
jgi:hypothetical protein